MFASQSGSVLLLLLLGIKSFFISTFAVCTLYFYGKSSTLAEFSLFCINLVAAFYIIFLLSCAVCVRFTTVYCLTRLIERDLLFSRIMEAALIMVLRPSSVLFYSEVRVLEAR